MSKGASPAGQTQTVNPTQLMQQPFLQRGWDEALKLFENKPTQYYPGQTLADYRPADPTLTAGYGTLNQAAGGINSMLPAANIALGTGLSGLYGGQYSPAYGGYKEFAGGTAAPQQAIAGYANQAAGPNAGLNQLMSTAGGAYLNANPYLDAMFKSASDPVARTYQTVTAPTTDARFSGGGRYGSGAAAGAQSSNEINLGKTLGDLSTGIYGANYARERQAQDAAALNYGQLVNQGLDLATRGQAAIGAGQQAGLAGLQGGFNEGNRAQQQALQMYPAIANAALIGPNAQIAAGKGLTEVDQSYRQYQQAQFDDAAKRFYGEQEAPYDTLGRFLKNVGQPQVGSKNEPYFQNQTANILSGLTGAAGLGNQLGLFGGSGGGLLGGLGAAGSAAIPAELGTAALAAGGLGEGAAAAALASEAGLSFGPAMAATAAGWIVCTELMRQGRMPKRHYLAGMSLFAGYPERTKRGYYVWAVPAVRHLRRHPNSRLSKCLAAIACWRSENIAAKRGVRGARRLVRGMLVSAIGYPICATLGYLVPAQDWQSVYDTGP